MSLHVTGSKLKLSKPAKLPIVTLGALALFITALPSVAATPQPQPATPAQSSQSPNATCPSGGQCFADVLSSNPFYAYINRIYQQDLVTGYSCGGPNEPCDTYSRPYYRPNNNVTRQQMAKFIDNARHLPQLDIEASSAAPLIYAFNISTGAAIYAYGASYGVYGQSNNNTAVRGQSNSGNGVAGSSVGAYGVLGTSSTSDGIYGFSSGGSGTMAGVYGVSTGTFGNGVYGHSTSGNGVSGTSTNSVGVYGVSNNDIGVYGYTSGGTNTDYGVSGAAIPPAQAGHFAGDVQVTGNLSKGAGSFKIDDPLDPANKYLYHSFVESPDMMNVYNGNVTLDARGEAIVQLPNWFGALNKDYRYQLTALGAPGPNLYVSKKVEDNRFSISGGTPGMEVSWQVTGIRQDPYANAHRIPVEEDKPDNERGKYLHPTEWGQPESSGIGYEEQQRMKEMQQANETKP
jgi:hypothetical protein